MPMYRYVARLLVPLSMGCLFAAGTVYAETSDPYDISADQVDAGEIKREVRKSFGKGRRKDPSYAIQRGMLATGLRPEFDATVNCRGIDDHWAMDYSSRRGRVAYHGGIDIPAPRGTPIHAIADGVVIAKFMNEYNPKGIEVMLRHSPQDTGLPMWTYTQYTHLLEMPALEIGQHIKMGQVIGKTSNTGISGREARRRHGRDSTGGGGGLFGGGKLRRDALHLGALYSDSRKYMRSDRQLIPVDAYWMDPNALFRKSPPYDSASLKTLPDNEKKIPIPYMLPNGDFVPAGTRVIWPYSCEPK